MTDKGTQLERTSKQLDNLAWLMDEYFKIPFVNWRFGIDSLIGLVPGAGDIASGIISLLLVVRALQFRLPKVVIARMILNTLIDVVVGAIPVAGDLFDFAWKSNSMNMRLFHRYAKDPAASTKGHWIFIGALILGYCAVLGLVAAGSVYFLWYVMSHWLK